jgi:hypothetical protein
MIRFPRNSLRPLIVVVSLTFALVAALALPVSAAIVDQESGATSLLGSHPVRDAITNVLGRPMDLPDVDAAVKLRCGAKVSDRAAEAHAAAVACEWSARDDLDVRSWQLWNLQIRPERGSRNLVVEVGADVTSHLDTQVTAPAVYIYAVLGLDGDGEIIARSRLQVVKLERRDHKVEPMRLECAAHRAGTDRLPAVTVGCHWSEVSNDAAVGYVIWKSVDGGARTVLARTGLETTEIRDEAVTFGHRYTYVATAVDSASHVVGRSRAEIVSIPQHDRPVDRPIDRPTARPVDTVPVDVAPVDRVRPAAD